MDKRVLFRADSSSKIGLGHIKRDLVYALRLRSKNISFATQGLEGNINHLIPYPIHTLKNPNVDELISLCHNLKIEHLILDNYALSYEDEKKIKTNCNLKLSIFDDTYEKHYCDEIINHNLGANAKKYIGIAPLFCKISLTPPLIREAFIQEKKHRKIKDSIFLSLGGTDHSNLSLKVLKALKPNKLNIILATTSSNPHLQALRSYAKVNPWLKLHIDANIAPLLNRSYLAIVTPSVLAAEAIFMDVEVISVRTADNQVEVERFLKKQRFTTLKATEIYKLSRLEALITHRSYKPYFQPLHIKTVSLNKATLNDLEDLFALANDPVVRQNSFSQEPISIQTHTAWFNALLKDENSTLYIIRSAEGRLISQVRFDRCEKKAIISIAIAQAFRGKGLVVEILQHAIEQYRNDYPGIIIEARIKKENISSQKSFEKAGFTAVNFEKDVLYYHHGDKDA